MSAPTVYAQVDAAITQLIGVHAENDPTVVAYMAARASLVAVAAMRGPRRAAELAYRLADEFSVTPEARPGAAESGERA